MNKRHIRGRDGERFAERYFIKRGFTLIARNWHYSNQGELDLIVRRGGLLVFVEVKTTGCSGINPVEQVTPEKERRLQSLAAIFLDLHEWARSCHPRIDVVAVYQQRGNWELVHYLDAVGE